MSDLVLDLIDITQSMIDGMLFGSTYALIGIGFTLIFGAMQKLNMTYTAASIAGAYVGLGFFTLFNLSAILVFLISIIASGIIGIIVYIFCFRFINVDNHLAALMASVGALFFIDEIIVHATNASPLTFPSLFSDVMFEIGLIGFRGDLLFVFFTSIISMILLWLLLYRSSLGLATRAVSQQATAAQLCGIDIHQTNAILFFVAGMLGGIAGVMIGAAVGILSPLLTIPFTVKGLIVTVMGGLGSIPGAIVAGFLVGALENLVLFFRGVDERDMYIMVLLFVFLVFKPHGIFSKNANRD